MTERRTKGPSTSDRWRTLATLGDEKQLELALSSMPSIRSPRVRIVPGAIQAELEGAMGSINEVSIHVPRLPGRIWPQVVRVMRRSASMREALGHGRVPRAFDRLIARVSGESLFPETRRVSSACTCGLPEAPCRHILALHELFARRLEEKPWELLVLRGVDLRDLLTQVESQSPEDGPPLAFGATEEPVLFPEGDGADLDSILSPSQVLSLLGVRQTPMLDAVDGAIAKYAEQAAVVVEEEKAPAD